jgi:adenylate cyclase class 2
MEEIEVKFLDVDKVSFEEKLVSFGATKVGDFEYRRKNYDFPDMSLSSVEAWVRLRDEGNQITLSYKQRTGIVEDALRDGGMKEIELVVNDFDTADQFLGAIGLVEKIYKENKRTRYMLDDVEVDIDSWPLMPTYVELEGKNWEAVTAVAAKLGFDWSTHVVGTAMDIYKVYGIDEKEYSVFTFDRQIKK